MPYNGALTNIKRLGTMKRIEDAYIASAEAARMLGITRFAVGRLASQGKIPASKVANRWLIPRAFVKDFAKTYVPMRGRPRQESRHARRQT